MRILCSVVLAASLLATPALGAPRQAGVVAATCELLRAWREVRELRHEGADGPALARAQARLASRRTSFCKRLRSAPAVQLLRGAFVDGPRQLFCEVKAHPVRTAAIVAGAIGLCTAAGMAGIPIDTVALVASAGLTAKAIAGNWKKVSAAFKKHSPFRWRTVGEDVVFPAAAFAAGVGMGAVAESATHAARVQGALGVGLKSTAQSFDDLVPLTTAFGRDKHGKKPAR